MEQAREWTVDAVPNLVGRNAPVIGPLILMGFVVALWYAFNSAKARYPKSADSRVRQLEERREQLLNHVAELDHRYESQSLGRQEYLRQRDEGKRRLRRVFLLMRKS
jgi:hypothetical protein